MRRIWILLTGLLAGVAVADDRLVQGRAGDVRAELVSAMRAQEARWAGTGKRTLQRVLREPAYGESLARHELLRRVGDAAWSDLVEEPWGPGFVRALYEDPGWLEDLLASGPWGDRPERVVRHLGALWARDAEGLQQRVRLRRIANAVALEYGRRDWPEERAWRRYRFFRDSHDQGLLHPQFDTLETWEMRYLTGHTSDQHWEPSAQEWLRDNVKLPLQAYRGACWQVPYRSHNALGDSVHSWAYYFPFEGAFDSYPEMTRFVGGVCGRLSGYGAAAATANGIPATTMGEPGHCAYAVRLKRGEWAPAYSLHWRRGVHMNLWGAPWSMLLLTEEMMGDRQAWLRASRHLWQAEVAVGGSSRAMAAVMAALEAQPIHYPAWSMLADHIADRPEADATTWGLFQDRLLKALGDFPELCWQILDAHVYAAVMPSLPVADRVRLMGGFHRALDGWGPLQWDVSGMLSRQAGFLEESPVERKKFIAGVVGLHAGSEDLGGSVLGWALEAWGEGAAAQQDFLRRIARHIGRTEGEVGEGALMELCSRAILGAEQSGDVDTFQAVGAIVRQNYEPFPRVEAAFPGQVLSWGGMLRLSSSDARWDEPYKHWLVLSPVAGFFHTKVERDPWVQVDLANLGVLTGIEILNRPGYESRAVPLRVEVSVDGRDWREVERLTSADRQWTVDLQAQAPLARSVRLVREGENCLHLQNIRVYGYRRS